MGLKKATTVPCDKENKTVSQHAFEVYDQAKHGINMQIFLKKKLLIHLM